MKKILILIALIISISVKAQSKKDYLIKNRFDLNDINFDFPQNDYKIIGFGAYHGSAKTENVEINLLKSLTKNSNIKYYLPETDFSIAHYFNIFLEKGDTNLLKKLVIEYGIRVPQERSIEVYKKWIKLKELNDNLPNDKKIKVVGIDLMVSYKYTAKYILELINSNNINSKPLKEIKQMVKTDTTDYSPYYNSYSKKLFKELVNDFENNKTKYYSSTNNKAILEYIIENLKYSFNPKIGRDEVMFLNYSSLSSIYDWDNNQQFLRMGFFHLEKSREGKNSYPSFFTRLIENKFYNKNQVISIIGFLTKSRVLWNISFDENGNYIGFNTFGGYGIGDYWKEHFKGISKLKRTKISDLSLYRLNKPNSPYYKKEPDLIEIIVPFKKSNSEQVKGMSTLDFIDYAVLISYSRASTPIYEMK